MIIYYDLRRKLNAIELKEIGLHRKYRPFIVNDFDLRGKLNTVALKSFNLRRKHMHFTVKYFRFTPVERLRREGKA